MDDEKTYTDRLKRLARWRRCPLLGGPCDQGVLIGSCPHRPTCQALADQEER